MSTRILIGDCRDVLRTLPGESVHCVVTSPPYFGLRDYGCVGQIGLESAPEAFVAELVAVFRAVRRVLRSDGTCWLNLGDSYAGNGTNRNGLGNSAIGSWSDGACKQRSIAGQARSTVPDSLKAKDLLGIPWRVAFALQADGWYLRQDIIWSKPNPMPESVRDRCTKAHEYLFLLSKSERYHFDQIAIAEAAGPDNWKGSKFDGPRDLAVRPTTGRRPPTDKTPLSGDYSKGAGLNDGQGHRSGGFIYAETRNRRSVWEIATQPFSEAHFATFPPALIEPCILAGCPEGGTVLDPFGGAGTTGLVADRLQRNAILIELNPEYAAMSHRRIRNEAGIFAEVQTEPTT